jgi:uncharacterized integral membrane protein (TIGR00697 family)
MLLKEKLLAQRIYLFLGALFITSLVVSNLIFQKFFYWYPLDIEVFGSKLFEISVGILPYPITFLITDLISEIFGKKRANEVVIAGIFASLFSLLIILVSSNVPATSWSYVDDAMFSKVFGNSAIAVFASMITYLFAQFVDIQIYHFWKRLTKGKYLWLRNNFSTWFSQFVDTFTILILLCSFKIIPWNNFYGLLVSGFLFKVLVALLDTPLLYLGVYLFRKRFKLKINEEIDLA